MLTMPIPNGRAEDAARDIASDIRKLGAEAFKLENAVLNGEASNADREKLIMMKAQIKSMSELCFYDVDTNTKFVVGDYVTKNREAVATRLRLRNESIIRRVVKSLFH